MSKAKFNISTVRHPHYLRDSLDWETWRDTFEGGEYYRDHYLEQFSGRETPAEFAQRRSLTPIPTFAKAAVLDVRNNIYQRLVGVSRVGGPKSYQDAVAGKSGGVDGEGSTMDAFIGKDILTELLVMGRVGCYVDAPPSGPTLADNQYPPYLTYYAVEDVLSYSYAKRGMGGEFQSVLLRDHNVTVETAMGHGISLPNGSEEGYRLVWKDENGQVWYKLFDKEGNIKLRGNEDTEDGATLTNLSRVPFVLFDIGDSLMKDVASYQKALLNLSSNDVFYAIKSNTPFLTIQRDAFAAGGHLKGSETAEGSAGRSEDVGAGKGRYYGINEEKPDFISPPTDPLVASMQLQERLEDNIRNLINLAVSNKAGSRTESAESKKVSQGGLEAGLSFIGLELEEGEKLIAALWAEYDNVKSPRPSTIKYPDRYVLKSDEERLDEAEKTLKLIERLPTQELKRTASKMIVDTLLGGRIPQPEVDKIHNKIDTNPYILSDPQVTLQAHKAGLCSDVTASEALGYDGEDEVKQAQKDRAERLAATIIAQTPGGGSGVAGQSLGNPAARGAPELGGDASKEKQESQSETKEPEPPQPGSGSEK